MMGFEPQATKGRGPAALEHYPLWHEAEAEGGQSQFGFAPVGSDVNLFSYG
jgi:hypothetical protein